MGGNQSRAEGARGIEGGAGERSGDENPERDGEANTETGDRAESSFFIHGGGEHDEDEEESGDGFQAHRRQAWEIADQLRSPEGNSTPGFFWDDSSENEGG